MKLSFLSALVAATTASIVGAASTFNPARPPAIPLAVKSPYLNTWLNAGSDGGNGGYLAGEWPTFWTGSISGWQGFINVDGTTYNWMGAAPGPATVTQTSYSYTSTKSIFVMNVNGKVEMTITFLSPVYPDDLGRQSITFTYLDVAVASLDGASHKVKLYADVTGEWASGDKSAAVNWSQGTSNGTIYHTFARSQQVQYSESSDQADWGNWYWATGQTPGITYQIGQDTVVRGNFVSNGVLPNTVDTNFRSVDDDWPVFAFAKDFGSVGSSSVSNLFTLGYTQPNAILFLGSGSTPQDVPSLWNSYVAEDQIVSFFYGDYGYALSYATNLDNKIQGDAVQAAGQNYATIVSLSFRQAFGGLAFAGTHDTPWVFLKEISSDGDIQTVDVIFPAHPVLLYTNPVLIKYLLDPLLINQEAGHYPKKNAIHDLGQFPQALGYPTGDDETMPLEECGNMLIMMLAYAQRTNDHGYLQQHWTIIMQWVQYLVQEAEIPANQLSTDDFAGHLANQTNLALKGIIGIKAVGQMAELTNQVSVQQTMDATSQSYLEFWMQHGIAANATPPHTNLQYDNDDTNGLLYNLYGDAVLNLGFVPQSVYDMQSAFYPTVAGEYGVPLDTRNTWTKADWSMFVAAITSQSTQAMLIQKLATWINQTPTNRAFTDLYMVPTGDYPSGIQFTARPVVGGAFALLALKS